MTSVTLLSLFGLLPVTVGCAPPDYGLNKAHDVGEDLDWIEVTDSTTIQISFDAAFQRQSFTGSIGRCQVQLAFLLEYEDDGFGESDNPPPPKGDENPEGPGTGNAHGPQAHGGLTLFEASHGQGPLLPTEPGECVLSTYNYDEPGEKDPPPDGEVEEQRRGEGGEQPQERANQGPNQGAWLVRGSIDLGDDVLLAGADSDVWLDRNEDAEGRVFYELTDCDEGSFPFDQTLDLEVPDRVGGGPGEFSMAEVFATGPEMRLVRPSAEHTTREVLIHSAGQHMSLAWEIDGGVPEVLGTPLPEERMLWFQTVRKEDRRFEEALACRPFEGVDHFLVPREWFNQMILNEPGSTDPVYESSFQIDLKHRAEPVTLGWAELGRVSSTVTEGGVMWLEASTR